ncbi:TMV resistance protein N-like [Coffea arabica]|uniref:TMV resistance protein N-like n=1 Tax=Coffea arabica TaxID=13443 RepID=A0ABM4VUV9_COFAR
MDAVNDRESEIALLVSSASNHHDKSWIDIPSSSSSSTPTWTYDVFLSFRGEDTRRSFVAHLFRALRSKGIYTYKDDQRLEKGKSISPERLQAIQESLFSIVIFSKGYASSTWCLEELVKITECHEIIGQSVYVLPIFYDVDPSDVRKQRNSFADAFAKHERDHSPEMVQKWKEAMSQAAGISGWHSCDFADDDEFIEKFVQDLHSQLHQFELPPGEHNLVGVGSHTEEVISLMDLRSPEVRIVGLHGKVGIGKTTVARALFDRLSDKYEAACFLDDVGQISQKHGVDYLQEILLSEMLKLRNVKIRSTSEGLSMMARRFRNLRTLIVLDAVDHANQLEALAGKRNWFGGGSRIVITARDEELLSKYGADGTYKVYGLSYNQAKQLFSLHAFGSRTPGAFRKHLVGPICSICRLPSSIKAWASLVRGRDIAWREVFTTIKPNGFVSGVCFFAAQLLCNIFFTEQLRLLKKHETSPDRADLLVCATIYTRLGVRPPYVSELALNSSQSRAWGDPPALCGAALGSIPEP